MLITYGQQKRDFVYIDDVCEAFKTILDNYKKFAFHYLTFEVGTGKSIPIRSFIENIKRISNSKTQLNFGKLPYREDEIMSSKADISFLENLGWKPTVMIEEGITKIITEYKKNGVIVNNNSKQTLQENKKISTNPIISLCIPSSGRISFLEKTLDSIFEQNIDSDFYEVCISDNSNTCETKELIEKKYKNKRIIFNKSNEHSYLNIIEALKLGSGKYLKLLNDYTSLSNNEILKFMIDVISKYDENTVFSFQSKKGKEEIQNFYTFDEFHKNLGYWDTSAPCFGISKKNFETIMAQSLPLNKWFPHVSLLYAQTRMCKNYVIINKEIFKCEVIKRKGGYNIPEVFGYEYIHMNEKLLSSSIISVNTFNFIRIQILEFIAQWYSKSIYDKKHCSFDFLNKKEWLEKYYSEYELKEFNKFVKKYYKSFVMRKLFFVPIIILKFINNRWGGVNRYNKTICSVPLHLKSSKNKIVTCFKEAA